MMIVRSKTILVFFTNTFLNLSVTYKGLQLSLSLHYTVLVPIKAIRGSINDVWVNRSLKKRIHCGGVGAVVKISASRSWGPRFDSRPGRGLNIWVTFFPAKVHSAFHPPGGRRNEYQHTWTGLKQLPEAPIYASGPLGVNWSL